MTYPAVIIPRKGMKFKYKMIIGFAGTALFLIVCQMSMQFMNSFRWVGFIKTGEDPFYEVAIEAQAWNGNLKADYNLLQMENEQLKLDKETCLKANNPELYE